MCGICGLIKTNEEQVKALAAMLDKLHHRGPEYRGDFHTPDGVSLGIQRLAIIDIDGGNQPIFNEDKSLVLVYNGEIFNFAKLRNELVKQEHTFKTNSDSEVLIHLYEQYGPAMLDKLRGQFSFVIWDTVHKRMFAARDRFGIKPFWYTRYGNGMAFASEPQALFQLPSFNRELDLSSVHAFLSFRAVPTTHHIFSGITALPPGHFLEFNQDKISVKRYWDYPRPVRVIESWDDEMERIEQLILDSIKYRLISDVPVGVMLSGGIDSALIVAMMNSFGASPFKTFFLGFEGEGEDYNENNFARQISDRFQTDHYELFITAEMIKNSLNDVITKLPLPCGDGIQKYFISKLVSEHGKVILSGSGGDEIFAGYQWFQMIPQKRYLDKISRLIPGYIKKKFITPKAAILTGNQRLKHLAALLSGGDFISRYDVYKSLFNDGEKEHLFAGSFPDEWGRTKSHLTQLDEPVSHLSEIDRIAMLQIKTDLTDIILLNEDAMSMANSVELRLPYLDHVLAEYVGSLEHQSKVKDNITKYIMKRIAEKYLPHHIIHREKHGFIMPITKWLQTDLQPYLESVFSQKSVEYRGIFQWSSMNKIYQNYLKGGEDHFRVWNLLMLELWLRVHFDEKQLLED